MLRKVLFALASSSLIFNLNTFAGPFADAVISYIPGTGVSATFTNTSTVLGEPSRVNTFGDATDPFNPAYGGSQILSVGAGGSLVIKFGSPVQNHPGNRFGIDFMIYGNSGFIITNDFNPATFEWIGTPATDSSLFAANSGPTRVSVSQDGTTWFTLNPSIAPTVDNLYPTDGAGDFRIPANPSLTPSSFAGATLDTIRSLYAGSAGGTGYDIAWAQNSNGVSVQLSSISFVRVDVLAGKSEIDGFSAVTTLTNDFATDPLKNGWVKFGDTNLFTWNSTNQNVEVTWDSSKTNSYFYIPTGTILSKSDDFSLELDLRLTDIIGGINPAKPYGFELSFGFLNSSNALKTNFFRGTGTQSPNLVEFDFFPDTGYGPTIWPSFWSTNSSLSYGGGTDYSLVELPTGVTMHVSMSYTATNKTMKTTITTNGVSIGAISDTVLSGSFTDFRVDTFAIESFNDFGDGGSILAHGTVDNVYFTVPPPPVQEMKSVFTNNSWQVSFSSRTNWSYVLERSSNLQTWSPASVSTSGTGNNVILTDTNVTASTMQFYRVRAERP